LYALPKPSPTKRRWSEAATMRADTDRLISATRLNPDRVPAAVSVDLR
jgi:hypothetical protein